MGCHFEEQAPDCCLAILPVDSQWTRSPEVSMEYQLAVEKWRAEHILITARREINTHKGTNTNCLA